jgi:hypothetical protein
VASGCESPKFEGATEGREGRGSGVLISTAGYQKSPLPVRILGRQQVSGGFRKEPVVRRLEEERERFPGEERACGRGGELPIVYAL